MTLRGVDLELIEARTVPDEVGLVVPNLVRINGQEISMPKGATVQIGEISEDQLVTVTMTMTVRSLVIRSEVPSV